MQGIHLLATVSKPGAMLDLTYLSSTSRIDHEWLSSHCELVAPRILPTQRLRQLVRARVVLVRQSCMVPLSSSVQYILDTQVDKLSTNMETLAITMATVEVTKLAGTSSFHKLLWTELVLVV